MKIKWHLKAGCHAHWSVHVVSGTAQIWSTVWQYDWCLSLHWAVGGSLYPHYDLNKGPSLSTLIGKLYRNIKCKIISWNTKNVVFSLFQRHYLLIAIIINALHVCVRGSVLSIQCSVFSVRCEWTNTLTLRGHMVSPADRKTTAAAPATAAQDQRSPAADPGRCRVSPFT